MKTTLLNISASLIAFLMLLACAGTPPESISLEEKLAKRGYVIGEPVKRLRDYRINGWNSIDRYSVIMNAGASKNYLVTVRSPCEGLISAEHLTFSTTIGDLTDKDKLVVRGAGRFLEQCYIDKIYSLTRINGNYLNMSVAELQAAMSAGRASAVELTHFYMQRIADLNPVYHAVINVNPDAVEIAVALDLERKEGKIRGPLHGIPVLLKDNINSHDPMPTTAGSLALLENYAVEDAPLVAGLRAGGAVILGKTNLSEWANIRSSNSISGWSAVGGFTRNAYRTDLNPCGSSAGSAVAAALNLAPLTVGSETDGSIICPASMNGVVGIKPGAGLVSQQGIVPISHTQDTAGPIARSMGDAVLLLDAMLTPQARQQFGDLSRQLQATDLQGMRIGVARDFNGHESSVDAVFDKALTVLEQAGAELVDVDDLWPETEHDMDEMEILILLTEMKADMAAYLATAPAAVTVRSMDDLVAFNLANAEQEMAHFKQEFFVISAAANGLDDPQYQQVLSQARELAGSLGIDAAIEKYQLDLLVSPSFGVAGPLKDERESTTPEQPGSTQLAAIAAYPGITVPMGMIQGLPLGISFFAGEFSEPVLIKAAAVFENRRQALPAPKISKDTDN